MKYKWLPVFSVENCSGCRACTSYCASGSLTIVDALVTFSKPELCLSDEWCVRECPNDGIHMEWLPIAQETGHGKVVDQKPAMQRLA